MTKTNQSEHELRKQRALKMLHENYGRGKREWGREITDEEIEAARQRASQKLEEEYQRLVKSGEILESDDPG